MAVIYVGIDEVGRGPLAGPLMSCGAFAVLQKKSNKNLYLLKNWFKYLKNLGVRDSKKVKFLQRERIMGELIGGERAKLQEKRSASSYFTLQSGFSWGFATSRITACLIDRLNIHQATCLSMRRSLGKVLAMCEANGQVDEVHVRVDGKSNPLKDFSFSYPVKVKARPKADDYYTLVSLASIIAKQGRDKYMLKKSELFPEYGWEKNFGYPTKDHQKAVETYGVTDLHRLSYRVKGKPLGEYGRKKILSS